ncbi:peptidoglycan-binding domain-containing protein [Oleisolibacter albus]|uniref:peptidoglycan-binding domain-containing protein n=1 Tax=Oleisolibacter albus TaxID=2171757 RepID=UPI000DF33036|nr:peptidoglycan-binding domain-containing protein [Oleisolibacter albus]
MSMPVNPHRALSGRSLLRVAALALIVALPAGPALAQSGDKAAGPSEGATVQWAQQILDAKGLYHGRAHGRMDAATAAAVSAYQKAAGLKATGRLDQATIDRMLAERADKQDPTIGNLADPKSRAKSSGPMLREQDVRPQAAPSVTGVERGEGGDQVLGGGSIGVAPPAATRPSARGEAAGGPSVIGGRSAGGVSGASQPQAAPSVPVEGAVDGAAPRSEVSTEGPLAGSVGDAAGFEPPDWARYGLVGATGLLVAAMAFYWWLSGRRPSRGRRPAAPAVPVHAAGPVRREPVLGPDPAAQRQGPALTAQRRDSGLRAGF